MTLGAGTFPAQEAGEIRAGLSASSHSRNDLRGAEEGGGGEYEQNTQGTSISQFKHSRKKQNQLHFPGVKLKYLVFSLPNCQKM